MNQQTAGPQSLLNSAGRAQLRDALTERFGPQLQPLVEQWQSNARLRMALWLILVLVLGQVISLAFDWRAAQAERFVSSTQRVQELQSLMDESAWFERASQAQTAADKHRGRLWRAASTGLARADVQSWFTTHLKEVGLEDARLTVLQLVDTGRDDIAELAVSARGSYTPEKIAKLLNHIEAAEQLLTVQQLRLINGDKRSFTLEAKAYFRAPADLIRLEVIE